MNEKLIKSPLAWKTYMVGGCVRDELMGVPVTDYDYVVEATQEEFESVFPLAKLVGQDFPVYIVAGDEVALTRTERSTGDTYGSFELTGVGVSVVKDLGRRDFTVNAMARNILTHQLVDPFKGREAIEHRKLRAVFVDTFKEDPVRILRAARFAARFCFDLDATTLELMFESAHMLQHATKERVELEVSKVWKQCATPSRFFKVLKKADALKFVMPELDALSKVPGGPRQFHGTDSAFDHTMKVVDRVAKQPYHVFVAAIVHDFGKAVTKESVLPHHYGHEVESERLAKEFFATHKFPKKVKRFAMKMARFHGLRMMLTTARPKKLVEHFSVFRRHEMDDVMTFFDADHSMSEKEVFMFESVRETLYGTDYSEVPFDKVHDAKVSELKRRMKV